MARLFMEQPLPSHQIWQNEHAPGSLGEAMAHSGPKQVCHGDCLMKQAPSRGSDNSDLLEDHKDLAFPLGTEAEFLIGEL